MKILYVKNTSERAKQFQLRTIIYQKGDKKFVKKEAINKQALHHLKKMKESYTYLKESIINPKIKLAEIIKEDENSLTFEFIEGESFQKKLNKILSAGKDPGIFLNEYVELIKNGFKTVPFDSNAANDENFLKLFEQTDYSQVYGTLCFDRISNIDLILSNIIQKGNDIYLIDYEWVYSFSIPVEYAIFRSLIYTELPENKLPYDKKVFRDMENSFMNRIYSNSFQIYKNNYLKKSYDFEKAVQDANQDRESLENCKEEIKRKDEYISYLEELAQSLRLKNRIQIAMKKMGLSRKKDI